MRHARRKAESCVSLTYSDDEREFLVALDRYKREQDRPHPTWAEVLAVAQALGYRRVAEPETPYRHLVSRPRLPTV